MGAALALNIANSNALACTGDGLTIVAGDGGGSGDLTVKAANHMDASAVADGTATTSEGGTSIGAAIAINVAHMNNEGSVGAGSVVVGDGVTVEATMVDEQIDITSSTIPIVDTDNDTIFLGASYGGLKNGDKVTYNNGGGTSIGGLTSGSTEYTVLIAGGGKIKLTNSGGTVVNLTSGATGTDHKFEHVIPMSASLDLIAALLASDIEFNPTGNHRIVNLEEGHGLRTGDTVTYDAGGGAVGGLVDGHIYYVILLEGNTAELAASVEDAVAGKAITLTSAGGAGQKLIDTTSTFRAEATSGASGGDVGIAGSVAINYAKTNTIAEIGLDHDSKANPNGPVTLTLGGDDVSIHAQNLTETHVTALPAGIASGSDVGVGASVALNISLNDTIAEIADGTSITGGADNFIVIAESDNTATTKAEAGAQGSTSVGGAIAIAVMENDTVAKIGSGPGGTIALTGDLGAEASHSDVVNTTASGEAAGGDVGVGIALALNIVVDDTNALVARSFSGADRCCRDLGFGGSSERGVQGERKGAVVRAKRWVRLG